MAEMVKYVLIWNNNTLFYRKVAGSFPFCNFFVFILAIYIFKINYILWMPNQSLYTIVGTIKYIVAFYEYSKIVMFLLDIL